MCPNFLYSDKGFLKAGAFRNPDQPPLGLPHSGEE